MPVCPTCGYENAFSALICAKCYTLLTTVQPLQTASIRETTNFTSSGGLPPKPAGIPLHDSPGRLGPDVVALYINRTPEPIIIEIARQAILGRHTPNSSTQPRVDLTMYGAFEMGVSRMHAAIRRVGKGLAIEDLASSNGTWLNGTRLAPFVTSEVKSGDTVNLSHLEVQIFFDDGTEIDTKPIDPGPNKK